MMQREWRDEVFMLAEVAIILNMQNSQVKNWTIGRPLRIQPTVPAYGTGTRNLYRVGDIYKMAIAKQMTASGATTLAIQSVLDKLNLAVSSCVFALLEGPSLDKNGDKTKVHLIHQFDEFKGRWSTILDGSAENSACHQLVNVHAISANVDALVVRFLKKHRKYFSSVQVGSSGGQLELQTSDDGAISARPRRKMRGF